MESPLSQPMVHANGLTKYYGTFVGVHDLSFVIPHGQIVAVLGPNGAGKTTLLRLLTGYLPATEGTAAIGGFDIRRDRLDAAALIGYLPENGPLYPDLTPLDVLRFFGEARRMITPLLADRIRTVSEVCGIRPILDRPIGQLSNGLR